MSLIGSETQVVARAIADITIDGRTTRMSTQWVKNDWEMRGQYGVEEQLKEKAKSLVKAHEKQWGPVKATIVSRIEERVTITQTYQSTNTTITSTTKAGTL